MSSPVEQIKQRLSVVDVVQSYIKLDKAGANFKARCPFHSEKTASFFVSPPRDIWHCFGCSRGGDIFGFVMEMEGVEFVEALKILAERAGIQLKAEDPRLRNERTRLLDLMKDAEDFYRNQLNIRKNVLDYLYGRGLKSETIQLWRLGYAPEETDGWRNLYEFLLGKGYGEEEIEKTGMIIKANQQEKRYYDRFRGRIMFPIFDFSGRIVAFSGRLFPEIKKEGVAKYINSPQTILYDKSRILYGFDKAKAEIRKKDTCVLVEGQMDVLMSHQAGVLNVAAISGIGLTVYHLDLIGRLADNLIVSFDSDEAGLVAAGRGIDLALGKGFEVKVVVLPFGKDPADVASKDYSAWEKAVEESRHIIDFYLQTLSEKIKEPRELKNKVEKIILPYVSLIESEIGKSHWIKEISKRLDIREESIWEQMKKIKLKEFSASETSDAGHFDVGNLKPRRLLLEERILSIAFWKNDVNIIPADKHFLFSPKQLDLLKKPETSNDSKNENKRCREKLSLEGELAYFGTEEDRLPKEIKILLTELEEEVLREERFAIMNEIKILEAKGEEEIINEKICKLNELNREITNLQKFKNEN
ncbi:MAG: DNA primase [Candidatus Tagabacteria bacterium RIFCSPLOWO2_01_FULL_42_9]|uniref:DNA primase n=1 Tax=Candidatus Tagabacteria bacterium RIFCSPLOWO2_01_FULL_42_9 TaxID=1802296 RepID=A0A1G2LXW0_9BACT|nr:MAG: DNA primase [Candidatus Tagabacteria bacterium RIFCSPLOWO2_01_FULL_42_9]